MAEPGASRFANPPPTTLGTAEEMFGPRSPIPSLPESTPPAPVEAPPPIDATPVPQTFGAGPGPDRAGMLRGAMPAIDRMGLPSLPQALGTLQQRSSELETATGRERDYVNEALQKRHEFELRALESIGQFREGQAKAYADLERQRPTLSAYPAPPDMRVRPWLDPEGKNALTVIAQSLGMLAVGIGGIVQKAPATALRQFREAAELWRRDELDSANSKWNEFQATMEGIRANNTAKLELWNVAKDTYGANTVAARAQMLTRLDELHLTDEAIHTAMLPYELDVQSATQAKNTAQHILDQVRQFDQAALRQKTVTGMGMPKNRNEAAGMVVAIDRMLKDEKDPDQIKLLKARRDDIVRQQQMVRSETEADARDRSQVGLAGKVAAASQQKIKMAERFNGRLATLLNAYTTLRDEGVPMPPSGLKWDKVSAWFQQNLSPEKMRNKNVVGAIGLINTFWNPAQIGADRALLDEKAGRFQAMYGHLHDGVKPFEEAKAILIELNSMVSEELAQQKAIQQGAFEILHTTQPAGVPAPDAEE